MTIGINALWHQLRRLGLSFKKRRALPSKTGLMWRRLGWFGARSSHNGIRGIWSSSTRRRSTPRWLGCMGAAPLVVDASAAYRMATGRHPRSSPRCAGEPRRGHIEIRDKGPEHQPLRRRNGSWEVDSGRERLYGGPKAASTRAAIGLKAVEGRTHSGRCFHLQTLRQPAVGHGGVLPQSRISI